MGGHELRRKRQRPGSVDRSGARHERATIRDGVVPPTPRILLRHETARGGWDYPGAAGPLPGSRGGERLGVRGSGR